MREFYLILVMQEQLSHNRQNKAIRCYKQTDSKRVKTSNKEFYVQMDGVPVLKLARHLSTYKIPCFKGIKKAF